MTDTYVYFIKPVGHDGPVKIGWSGMPHDRLMALATWSPYPLELVATMPGGKVLEQNIHECFADQHSHREWFHPSPRLTLTMHRVAAGEPIAAVIDLNDRRGSIVPNNAGGAGWQPHTRAYMGLFHRLRAAANRQGISVYSLPRKVDRVLNMARGRLLSDDEMSVVEAYCAKPAKKKAA